MTILVIRDGSVACRSFKTTFRLLERKYHVKSRRMTKSGCNEGKFSASRNVFTAGYWPRRRAGHNLISREMKRLMRLSIGGASFLPCFAPQSNNPTAVA